MCRLTKHIETTLGSVRSAGRVTPGELHACLRALRAHLAAAEIDEQSIAQFVHEVLDRMTEALGVPKADSGVETAGMLQQALRAVPAIRRAMGHAAHSVPHFERGARPPRWNMKELSNRTALRGWRALRPAAERGANVRGALAPVRLDPRRFAPCEERCAVHLDREKMRRLLRSLGKGRDGQDPPDIGQPALLV